MKNKITFSGTLLAVFILAYFTVFSVGKQEIKLLVFSKTAGFRHQSIETGIEALKKLGEQNNFQIEATEDASVFKEEYLKDFNAVIFLNTTGDILEQEQQKQMERFIQAGGGFVGIHAAADTEYDWPWYGKLVGGYFESHPKIQEATLHIVDKKHPATRHLSAEWQKVDEWYNYKNINPKNKVLIKLDESTYEGGTNGDNHPMAWYKEYDGGRAFYTGMGHTDESYADPLYMKHVLGGIKYAIGKGKAVDYSKVSQAH